MQGKAGHGFFEIDSIARCVGEHLACNPCGGMAMRAVASDEKTARLMGVSTARVQAFAWAAVVGMVAFVAVSRMYRGMHHPLDVAGGIAVGIAAVIMVVFVSRTAGAAAKARKRA